MSFPFEKKMVQRYQVLLEESSDLSLSSVAVVNIMTKRNLGVEGELV